MLTGPGGAFEVVTEDVRGIPLRMFKQRMKSLREVAAAAIGRGDAEDFIVYGEERIGFGSFIEQANGVSRGLAALGVGPGDRVAVLSANNPEWCLTFWGAVNLGAVLVGLNGWWKADEIVYGLEDSGAKILIADRPRLERVASMLESIPTLEKVFVIDEDFDSLIVDPGPAIPDTPIDEDDPAVIFYTSGTTGKPKGAVSTHRSMIANLQNTFYNAIAGAMTSGGSSALTTGGGTPPASLLTSPLFHVSGCHSGMVMGLAAGIKLVLPVGKFEPEKAMQLIQDEKVTVWATVPTMVWRVVEHPDRASYDLGTVTTVAYGGSPSAAELQRRVQETFPNIGVSMTNAYGLTETSSVATSISGQEFMDRPDSVGRPMPVVEVQVVSADGAIQPAGEQGIGEVWIRGPIVMPGYWNRPDATAEMITPDGWLKSGDVGYLDEDGYLFITDRAKDMIIRGGENVYCVEIENRLIEHPAVAEAGVIGVPHQSLGEEVKAVVRLEPGAAATESELAEWVAATLANFKVPVYWEFATEQLPRNPSGKLLKNVLRGEGVVSFAETL